MDWMNGHDKGLLQGRMAENIQKLYTQDFGACCMMDDGGSMELGGLPESLARYISAIFSSALCSCAFSLMGWADETMMVQRGRS
jgi:hypothetical protein